jgi:nucleolar pre-ribosomal-associated protein 1
MSYSLQFDVLFRHSSEKQMTDIVCQETLVDAALMCPATVLDIKRVFRLIEHRMRHSEGQDRLGHGLIVLLASIFERSSSTMSSVDIHSLKEFLFVRPGIIKDSLMSKTLSNSIREGCFLMFPFVVLADRFPGYYQLVKSAIDPRSENDRMLVSDISSHWLETLKRTSLSNNDQAPFQVSSAVIWTKYFQATDLFDLLDTLGTAIEMTDSSTLNLLDAVLVALQSAIASDTESEVALVGRLPQLLKLRPLLCDSDTLEEMIAAAVEVCIPAHCDEQPLRTETPDEVDIVSLLKRSEVRWSRHLEPLPTNLPIHSFLMQERWSISTTKIISGLIYRRLLSPDIFFPWLSTEHCATREVQHFVPILQTFLDVCASEDRTLPAPGNDVWNSHLARLVQTVVDESLSPDLRATACSCVSHLLKLNPNRIAESVAVMVDHIQALPVTSLTAETLVAGRRFHEMSSAHSEPLLTTLVDHGIQWAVRYFSDDDPDGSSDVIIKECSK